MRQCHKGKEGHICCFFVIKIVQLKRLITKVYGFGSGLEIARFSPVKRQGFFV